MATYLRVGAASVVESARVTRIGVVVSFGIIVNSKILNGILASRLTRLRVCLICHEEVDRGPETAGGFSD
jgi:hypothetical protein